MTKTFKRMILGLAVCGLAGIMTACGGNDSQAQNQAAASSSVVSDSSLMADSSWIDEEDESTADVLNDYVEVTEIQTEKENTFSYDYEPDAEEFNYCAGHSFTPEKSGMYSVRLYNIDTEEDVNYYVNVWDDNMNRLLQLAYNSESSDEEMTDSTELMAGETYYLTLSAYPEDESAHVTGEVNYKIVLIDSEIETDQITQDEPYTVSLNGGEYAYLRFDPDEDGYYYVEAVAEDLDADYTASVYAVLKNGEEDVDTGEGLLELEKGSEYYIVFGLEDKDAQDINVSVLCTKLDAVVMKNPGTEKIGDNGMVLFTPETSGRYLLYSVSDLDLSGSVYDADGDVIAENDDANGYCSENEKDFAMYIDVRKGKQYLILIDPAGDTETVDCEFHIEESEE